jgi:hypothetical protein
LTDLAKGLGMTQPGVGYAVKIGECISEKNNFWLREWVSYLIMPVLHIKGNYQD